MTLQLLVNGVDFTSSWRVYESRWSTRAWQGESVQSEFLIDDPDGSFTHDNFRARKIVEVWEDASGSPICMYRGRIANKTLGPGAFRAPGQAFRWTLLTEDFNIDLRGIRVINATRPEETNYDRAEVIRLAYLNGAASTHPSARDSTDLDGLYIGPTPGDAYTLDAETYTDTDPVGVLAQMTEMDGHLFFVYLQNDGVGALVYMGLTDMELLSNISIVDDGEDEDADGEDIFAAYWTDIAGDHGGQNVLSGAAIRYGDEGNYFEDSNVGGREAIYDKWEITVSNDLVTSEASADQYLNTVISANEEVNTYFASIDIKPSHVHRIKAGMMVPLIRKRANKLGDAAARAVNVTYEPTHPRQDGEAMYRVTMELGRPRFLRTIPPNRRHIPRPDSPNTPPTVVTGKLYYTSGGDSGSGLDDTDYSGSWDVESLSVSTPRRLRTTPQDTYFNSGSGTSVFAGVNIPAETIVTHQFSFPLSDSADILAGVQQGGTWRTVIRSKNRYGVGVNEATQANYPDWTIRIYRPGTGFIGTLFDVGDGTAAYKFDPGPEYPSIPMSAVGAAVPSAVGSDYLVVELGADHVGPTSGATGFDYRFSDQSAVDDLPFVVDSQADQNSWLDVSTAGGDGTDGKDEELVGEPSTPPCYASCTHRHHVTRDRAPTPADDIQGYPEGTFWVQVDALPRADATEILATYLSVDDTADAAVWLLQADPASGSSGTTLTIEEEDGTPTGVFDTLKVPNTSLTDNGDGSASLDLALTSHAHEPPTPGVHKILIQRTTNFTTANNNNSMPDYDTVVEDTMTDSWFDAGDPDRLVVTADYDGLDAIFTAKGALGDPGSSDYLEAKMYLFPASYGEPRPLLDVSGEEDHLLMVDQQHADDNVNQFDVASSDPVTVHTGDVILVAWRTSTAQTLIPYNGRVGITLGAYIVGTPGPEGPPGETDHGALTGLLDDDHTQYIKDSEFAAKGDILGGTGSGTFDNLAVGANGTVLTADSAETTGLKWATPSSGGVGRILISDTHSTPLVFGDLLQNDDGDNLLYEDE